MRGRGKHARPVWLDDVVPAERLDDIANLREWGGYRHNVTHGNSLLTTILVKHVARLYLEATITIRVRYGLCIKIVGRRAEDVPLPTDDRSVQLEAGARAHRAMPKAAAISWPIPADRRLDQLVELANDAGAGTSRGELAAAIVSGASTDGEQLLQLIVKWRTARVRDVVAGVRSVLTL